MKLIKLQNMLNKKKETVKHCLIKSQNSNCEQNIKELEKANAEINVMSGIKNIETEKQLIECLINDIFIGLEHTEDTVLRTKMEMLKEIKQQSNYSLALQFLKGE